jgi:hypothetical protein
MTFRPFFVDILARNPWVFFRLRLCGWYVLFIVLDSSIYVSVILLLINVRKNWRTNKKPYSSHFSHRWIIIFYIVKIPLAYFRHWCYT